MTQCESVYDAEVRCELKKGHKGLHQFTKFWGN